MGCAYKMGNLSGRHWQDPIAVDQHHDVWQTDCIGKYVIESAWGRLEINKTNFGRRRQRRQRLMAWTIHSFIRSSLLIDVVIGQFRFDSHPIAGAVVH